ncbi:hypothetical protein VTN31DRAFT_218 [Thermomyces dupontii]|uniref:uncharacterized protein n=1 Tax=Talaromyces thermophilus TaxID=28565 RepID=UPI003742398C
MTTEVPMYAFHQTELYQPPPVVKGKVPKNAYGNLDVYVPSMVPPGAFHLKHPEAARAARILGIDYADAVTGFEFRGRRGTAVINGIVAAVQYREALEEVIRCIEDEKVQEALDRRSKEVLRLWKHFLIKLRIAEKVKGYTFEGEDAEDERESDEEDFDPRSNEEAGGFFPEPAGEAPQPTSVYEAIDTPAEPGGFVQQVTNDGGGFIPESDDTSAVADTQSHAPRQARDNHQTHSRYTLVVVPQGQQQQHLDGVPSADPRLSDIGSRAKSPGPQEQTTTNNSSKDVEGSRESAPIVVDSSSTSVQVISRPPSGSSSRAPSQDVISSDDDSNLEQRSLLSHDPEDEDAEPEWLLSD